MKKETLFLVALLATFGCSQTDDEKDGTSGGDSGEAVPLEEAYWPEFRGEGGVGHTDGKLPLDWGEGQNVRWKTAIHGKGWSSPVVWKNQVWMTTSTEDGKTLSGLALDLGTGAIVHDVEVVEVQDPAFCHPENSYASPTPVIEEGRVYLHFGSAGTVCLDTQTAKPIWTRTDLPCDHYRGPGSSPILDGERLIIHFDGFDERYVVALNKENGETIWKKDRDIDYGTDNGDFKKAYGTPTVIEHEGRRQLISPTAVATIAYDPATGDELWRVRHGGMNACARPIYGHGLVYINAGDDTVGVIAVRPDGLGDVTKTHIAWTSKKSYPRRPTMLLVGERLYMVSDLAIATCLNAKTGEVLWRERLGGGPYWASPIRAGERLYFFDREGLCPVIEVADEYKVLKENRVESGFYATPAVAGDSLILRTKTHVYRVEQI